MLAITVPSGTLLLNGKMLTTTLLSMDPGNSKCHGKYHISFRLIVTTSGKNKKEGRDGPESDFNLLPSSLLKA